jgi:hypothetical protein
VSGPTPTSSMEARLRILRRYRTPTTDFLSCRRNPSLSGTFTSLPSAQGVDGEDPYIDTKDVLKLLIVGDSAVRLLVTLGARSAW